VAGPEVPIDVDPDTGIWRTDGMPMVYLPRHFLVNNHLATEAALGRDAYRGILRTATEKSAIAWCQAESKSHGLAAEATVRHYFKRLSQRGWGRFSVLELSARQGLVALENSVFVLEAASRADQPICYMFAGFVLGALRFLIASDCIGGDHHKIVCEETQCAAMGQHDRCLIRFIETGQ
jgi:hypothetical protein